MWLSNVRVVDVVAGTVGAPSALQITEQGRIGTSAPAPPPEETSLDLGGMFLMPGLISVHSHLSVVYPFSATDAEENPAVTVLRSLQRAQDALYAGVTTVRSVHEINQADLLLRTASQNGWVQIPRILGAGRAISTTEGHGKGVACSYADGFDEFLAASRTELEAGADHVKVFITGGLAHAGESMQGPQMTGEEMRAVVQAATEHDTYVVAHAANGEAIAQAMDAGIVSFEHAYSLSDEVAKEMARRQVFLTPTLCVSRCPEWMADHDFTPDQVERAMEAGPEHLASIRRAVTAGVRIVAGTDYPPGEPIEDTVVAIREMEFLAEAGLDPVKVLQAGTVTAAQLLGLAGQVGEVAQGQFADLIAVDRDPLSDVRALRNIKMVFQAGQIVRDFRNGPA